jgi:hypothetical protein
MPKLRVTGFKITLLSFSKTADGTRMAIAAPFSSHVRPKFCALADVGNALIR